MYLLLNLFFSFFFVTYFISFEILLFYDPIKYRAGQLFYSAPLSEPTRKKKWLYQKIFRLQIDFTFSAKNFVKATLLMMVNHTSERSILITYCKKLMQWFDGVPEGTVDFQAKQGVHQGCILSLQLINIYNELIIREANEHWTSGISIGGIRNCNLQYLVDTTLIALAK